MRHRPYIFLFASALASCAPSRKAPVKFQPMGLYDISSPLHTDHIDGFKAVHIFSDDLGREVWVSPEKKCVTMERVSSPATEGDYSMHITWDKVSGGCKWIGLGFGWSDWMGKDMTGLESITAVQMKVRAVKGTFKNLPVAFAFEDYTDIQTYCGFRMEHASGEFNDKGWTTVTVPLRDFPFERNNADLSKIKQFMIQLEGDGDIYLDDIRLIRYQP
ncbi:MAG: glycan-binding surface protein [Bacteroidota bacterium]